MTHADPNREQFARVYPRPPRAPGNTGGDTKPREPGCQCHLEEGDSPCPVHDADAFPPEGSR